MLSGAGAESNTGCVCSAIMASGVGPERIRALARNEIASHRDQHQQARKHQMAAPSGIQREEVAPRRSGLLRSATCVMTRA